MLKISNTKSVEPKKDIVGVGNGGRNRAEPIGKHKFDGNDSGSCSENSNSKYSSDVPKLMYPPAPLTLMLKTSSLTNSSTKTTQIVVKYDRVDDNGGQMVI